MATLPLPGIANDAGDEEDVVEQPEGAMSDSELAAHLDEHERRSIGYFNDEIAGAQEEALDRYYRRPYGDERKGRSSVVDGTVAVVIDNATAAILKPFTSADDAVRYEPKQPEDEEGADQATEYINYVFLCELGGFLILHNWVKEALLLKLGIVKAYWEDQSREREERVENLDPGQAFQLQQEGAEVYGPDEAGLYTALVENTYNDGRMVVENVPVEEYRLSPLARPGRTPPYEAHIRALPRSDVVEMGFDADLVDGLAAWGGNRTQSNVEDARHRDEGFGQRDRDAPGGKARDLILIAEEYVLIDYDGDGISELRKVIRSDHVILFNEEVDDGPFALLTPVPMPHKVIGPSLADLVLEEQRISTVILRQTLDNLYLTNNPRVQVPEGSERNDGVTIDDLLDPSPGGPVRTGREPLVPLVIPFVADKSFPMLDYFAQQAEQKTGIGKVGQGLDADTLKKSGQVTATQMAMVESGKNMRVEMIARIFAETGITRLFKLMLKLLVNHQPRERMVRLRGKWVPVDPRSWNAEMDVTINVGLGVGNKAEAMQKAQVVVETMAAIGQTQFASLIDEQKAYNALKRQFQAAGIKNIDEFLNEPEKGPDGKPVPKEPPPDPEMVKVQAEAQARAAEIQGKQQVAAADMQLQEQKAAAGLQQQQQEAEARLVFQQQLDSAKLAAQREQADQQLRLDAARAAAENDLAERKMLAEIELEREKMTLQHEADMQAAQHSHEIAMQKNREGGALDK